MVKKKACIFISGSGTNLRSIIKSSRDYNFPVNINLVISSKKSAAGINFAKKFSIPCIVLDVNKKKFEKIVIKELLDRKISLICLAGFMKILSKNFVRNFKGKIINIHPSLLPSFPGANAHRDVIQAKAKTSGCTVHFVDEGIDTGPIITQASVDLSQGETEDSLSEKILPLEHQIYPKAIELLCSNKIKIDGENIIIKPN